MKLSIAKFEELKGIAPIVANYEKDKKKEIKFKLIDDLREAFGDKWYNMKEDTKQALQYACMRSTEQGFFYFGWKHLKEKYDIKDSTIYSIFKTLIEAKKIVRVNRTSTKQNGKGSAVYIFVNHPNFPIICDLLKLDWKTDCKADCKTESDENPCGSKDESDNSAPTYSLPPSLPKGFKDNVKHYNVKENQNVEAYEGENDIEKILREKIKEFEKQQAQGSYEKPSVKFQKYVPKVINEKFGFFGEILTDLWRKIKLAERKVNVARLKKEDKLHVAEKVLNNLKKHPRFKVMSLDEMCAYVYKGQLDGLFSYMGYYNLEGMYIDENYSYYAYVDSFGEHHPTRDDITDITVVVDIDEAEFITYGALAYDYDHDDVSCGTFKNGNLDNWLEWA